jgi:bile acid:Na+ symporter, BASS family
MRIFMRRRDLLLFVVVFGSMAAAVLFPELGTHFQPFILYLMMLLLFLSFLSIDFRALFDTSSASLLWLAKLVAVKLIAFPALFYWLFRFVLPEYAVPALLLSGISTGVVAPFIGLLLNADVPLVLRTVIVSSLLVPFTLPPLVELLAGAEVAIPIAPMMKLLAQVIFIPLTAVFLIRRFRPGLLEPLAPWQYPISLTLFAVINLGVFSRYSSFFFQNPGQLFLSIGVAYALSFLYYAIGFALTPRQSLSHRISAAISLAVMNNVLVIVFSSEFFGPLCPTLAAMYMFPFYTMIVPVRLFVNRYRPIPAAEAE